VPSARDEALDHLRGQALVEPAGAESLALLRLVILIDGARALTGLVERLARDVADLPSAVRNLI
jgi:hypothetical protein